MSAQAHVTSLVALETFRASMIVFRSKSQGVVDQVLDEIRRTRSWLQEEQRRHWENEVKRCDRNLVQAKAELSGVRIIGVLHNFSAQQAQVRKAREALEHAELKLRHVKKWSRDFDSMTEPLAKTLDSFSGVLAREVPEAIEWLRQVQITLAAYREGIVAAPAKPAPAQGPAPDEA